MAVMEMVRPRICWVPEPVGESLGRRAIEWAREHKMKLDAEQEFMLEASFALDEDGRWQVFEWVCNAPRQNGKGEILMVRELFGIYELGEMLIVHSAHEFKTSARHFKRLEQAIRKNPDLLWRVKKSDKGQRLEVGFRYSHGDEAIELDTGAKIEFRTRTKTGMKGYDDVALLVLDEAQVLSEWAHGSMVPTMRASTAERGPQLWYAGNAADQDRDHDALVWTRLRERGIEGDDPSLAYFEYSIDCEGPDDVPDEVLMDPDVWRATNWAMAHGRVTEAHMVKELRTLGRRQFIVELLGGGDYPDTDMVGNTEISDQAWADCEDESSTLEGALWLAVDVSPGRRSSLSVAGLNRDGKKHVETLHSKAGTGWVPDRVAELCERHEIVEIACDGFGPANTIADRIEETVSLPVRRLKTGEYADACGMFANEVEERTVRHIGQDELTTAVRGARTRPLVDRWAWSRSKSKMDPGPLISASVALWSAVDGDIGNSKVQIY